MQMSVPFGESWQKFEVSDKTLRFTGRGRSLPPLQNLEKAIIEQLDAPTGTAPLKELARGKKNIVMLIEDNTRNTPLSDILPILVGYLNYHGVRDENISFLTAPGTHRVMTEEEIKEKIGPAMYGRFKVDQHNINETESLVHLGYVMSGDYEIPVQLNRNALEADLLIGLGDIVPHSDAGYSGGAKIVQPGICGYATTAATHIVAALLADIPLGVVENPCRAGMEKVAEKAGLAFILNTVKNLDGEVVGLFGGDFVKAHRKGALLAEESYKVKIMELVDIVIVSASPCDIDYWQGEKGLVSAYFAVKPGGIIIFAAHCIEGLVHNHPSFREWLSLPLDKALIKARNTRLDDANADLVAADVAICNAKIREKARIFIVTAGLSEEDIGILGYEPFESVQEALDEALKRIPGGTVGVLPKGGVSLPRLE